MLSICAWEDIKSKRIHAVVIYLFSVVGVVYHLLAKNLSPIEMLGGVAVGGLIYLLAQISREQIGKGDGLIVAACGIYIGFFNTIFMVLVASFFALITGLIIRAIKGRGENLELPFVPFILVAYIFFMIIG